MYAARIFVVLSSTLIICGWALSFFGSLSAPPYILAIPFMFWGLWHLSRAAAEHPHRSVGIRWRRYRRWPVAVFAALAFLCFLGGIFHAPNNYDFLTYRLSRLLHWHEAGAWHWIMTGNGRMNYSAPNTEWITSPLLAFTQSDRLLFLPSFFAFLLLPSAIFTTFRGMGITSRAAWWAMWLVPTAYCYVSQAGGAGNDLLGTTFFMISMAFLVRSRASGCSGCFIVSILAIAICTGVKATNLPLLAPWGIAAIQVLKSAPLHWPKLAAAAVLALACSFAPMAALNHIHAGNWKGKGAEDEALEAGSALGGMVGNTAAVAVAALQPPLLPLPRPVNETVDQLLPEKVKTLLRTDFPRLKLQFVELPNEENAGLGLGILVLVAASFIGVALTRRSDAWLSPKGVAVVLAMLLATLVYMSAMASESAARLLSPYYPLLLAVPFGAAGAHRLINSRLWQVIALAAAISALVTPLITPSRPLLPAGELASYIFGEGPLTQRIQSVYKVYSQRADNLASVRDAIPQGAQRIGFLGSGDDIEISLWRPFSGPRSVVHLSPDQKALLSVDAFVVSDYGKRRWPDQARQGLDAALSKHRKVGSVLVTSKVSEGPIKWSVYVQSPSAPTATYPCGPNVIW
jgi:hypothetical protein